MIRTVKTSEITENIKEMCIEANFYLSRDMDAAMKNAAATEESELGQKILNQMPLMKECVRDMWKDIFGNPS